MSACSRSVWAGAARGVGGVLRVSPSPWWLAFGAGLQRRFASSSVGFAADPAGQKSQPQQQAGPGPTASKQMMTAESHSLPVSDTGYRYIHRKAGAEDAQRQRGGAGFLQVAEPGEAARVMSQLAPDSQHEESEPSGGSQVEKPSSTSRDITIKGLTAADVLSKKSLLRQQLEVHHTCTITEAITLMVNQRVTSFMVVDDTGEVIGLFTARDLLGELARYPHKEDGLKARASDFMIPLNQMVFCSPQDSLYQCLLIMSELNIRNLPVVSQGQVLGIINVNDISDYTFSREELGGKKNYIANISERRGLKQGVHVTHAPEIPGKSLSVSIGSAALPHPFKTADGVSASCRDHRHLELASDPTLSEDSHFVLSVAWPTPHSDVLHLVGVADGVGSWRKVGVDPRHFSRRIIHWAQQYVLSVAPGAGAVSEPQVLPPKPHKILSAAYNAVVAEGIVGSSTCLIASLDNELEQLTFSNIGDAGVVILRHIDSDVAGYMREKSTPRHLRDSDLRIAFISQQQLRSFNLPYQLGHTNVNGASSTFETPRDAVNTSFPVMPGDIVILATDGLYDNMELEEMCSIAQAWETKWFGGPLGGLTSRNDAATNDLAEQLANRARELSLDDTRDSPFALLAKENDIMWGGGMPDDVTVCVLRPYRKSRRTT
jgi:protein phosphatase PTC7